MIRKLSFLILFISATIFAQDNRIQISGGIDVPETDEPDGITIFNESTSRGTISNKIGQFQINAGLNDRLVFSSLQFEQFSVRVTEDMLESGILNVAVNVAVNELPEVNVVKGNLTGSVRVDVNRIKVTPAQLPDTDADRLETPKIATPYSYPIRNQAELSSRTYMVNGLNLINVFKVITGKYGEEETNYRVIPYNELDDEIKEMYSNDFFKETLDLEADQVNAFVFFAADNGLNGQMLSEENDLDIIQFLVEQRQAYQSHLNTDVEKLD
ncbi:hypothetical protein [Zunongwangia endophytica]|uniref:CarboxypepD_reg-like domain-containing protein n=1 Tax=Zunongwangia endophytica TaxID=1808945 RepID=A0ABV8H2W7_9FLAO|nr:hypothetical protein [Zunongwangia endophytica]MDN3596518.1 hypothetical protein [Zunongwangia endophytica]